MILHEDKETNIKYIHNLSRNHQQDMKKYVYVKNIITIYQIKTNENTINIGNNTIGTTLHTHSKEQLLSPTETKRYTVKRCCIVEENKFQSRYSNATEVVSGSGLHLSAINKSLVFIHKGVESSATSG